MNDKQTENVLKLHTVSMISFIVFHVFLISNLYLAKVDTRNCCLAARMLIFNILLYVLRIIYIISYTLEVGFVNFILLYRLSRNLIGFSSPLVFHLDFFYKLILLLNVSRDSMSEMNSLINCLI